MSGFEALVKIVEESPKGVYAVGEMSDGGYVERQFRPGHGPHNVYSLSKSVTGCAVGILESEGRLRDTDTVFSYIGDLFPRGYDPAWERVTLRHVMLHRTGVPAEANIDIDSDTQDFRADGHTDFLGYFLSMPIVTEPGEGPFVYCDTNYYLIGRIVERVTGMKLADFLRERMFVPMRFRGDAWGDCPNCHTLGGTGLFLRPRDLCAYGYMLACGGVFEGRRIVPAEWIEKARGERGEIGYGFHNSADGRWFFAGGMGGQGLFIFPETRRALCILGYLTPIEEIEKRLPPLCL